MTENDDALFIEIADFVLLNAPKYSPFRVRDYVITYKESNQNIDLKSLSSIHNYLLDYGFVKKASLDAEEKFILSDIGRDVALQGGINEYWEYTKIQKVISVKNLSYTKTTMIFIIIYTALTLGILIVGIIALKKTH